MATPPTTSRPRPSENESSAPAAKKRRQTRSKGNGPAKPVKTTADEPTTSPPIYAKNKRTACVLLYPDDDSKIMAASLKLDPSVSIGADLLLMAKDLCNPHLELRLSFPRGDDQRSNEAAGFGVIYKYDWCSRKAELSQSHYISIEFSQEKKSVEIDIEDGTEFVRLYFQELCSVSQSWAAIKFKLNEASSGMIKGWGLPFRNRDNQEIDDWVNRSSPLSNGKTLLQNLQSRELLILIAGHADQARRDFDMTRLPAPRQYPYTSSFAWDNDSELEANRTSIRENEGKEYLARFLFSNITEHLMCIAQSCLQDVMWLYEDAKKIHRTKIWAYMAQGVQAPHENQRFVIIHINRKLQEIFNQAWVHFTHKTNNSFHLSLYKSWDSKSPEAEWECELVKNPELLNQLDNFRVSPNYLNNELILLVRIPKDASNNPEYLWSTYTSHSEARTAFSARKQSEPWNRVALRFGRNLLDDVKRQVKSLQSLQSFASPTNEVALRQKFRWRPEEDNKTSLTGYSLEERQKIQANLLCGQGFIQNLAAHQPELLEVTAALQDAMPIVEARSTDSYSDGEVQEDISEPPPHKTANLVQAAPLQLRYTNWIDTLQPAYVQACLRNLALDDRMRTRMYLRERPLGIGIFTASPGCGKSFILASSTLLMHEKEGKALASGPSQSSVSLFAQKLDELEKDAVEFVNLHKTLKDPSRRPRKLIVCANQPELEAEAFLNMLAGGNQAYVQLQPDCAAGSGRCSASSAWTLPLSTAQLLLLAWGWPKAGRSIDQDDPSILFELRDWLSWQWQPKWRNLREVLQSEMSWTDYAAKDNNQKCSQKDIICQFKRIWERADILCITPALSESVPEFRSWKMDEAQAMAIDDASNMSKADLYSIWGNCLMPLLMAGDVKQSIMTTNPTNRDGQPRNCFSEEGKVSGQLYLQYQGIPVYRRKTKVTTARC